jgi:hypothetical protein
MASEYHSSGNYRRKVQVQVQARVTAAAGDGCQSDSRLVLLPGTMRRLTTQRPTVTHVNLLYELPTMLLRRQRHRSRTALLRYRWLY